MVVDGLVGGGDYLGAQVDWLVEIAVGADDDVGDLVHVGQDVHYNDSFNTMLSYNVPFSTHYEAN